MNIVEINKKIPSSLKEVVKCRRDSNSILLNFHRASFPWLHARILIRDSQKHILPPLAISGISPNEGEAYRLAPQEEYIVRVLLATGNYGHVEEKEVSFTFLF